MPFGSGVDRLMKFGTPSMGVAGAGIHVVASDASTSFHNAAGMRWIKDIELMGTGRLLNAIKARNWRLNLTTRTLIS